VGSSRVADDLPHELRVGERTYLVTRAGAADVAAVVALLRDDELGAAREPATADDLAPYRRAFEQIDADPNQLLVVVRRQDEVVATLQLTFLRTLSRQGALRMQVEAVRVAGPERGAGLGRALLGWAVEAGRARGAVLAQLTTDRRRVAAHRFYARLGWVDTHRGMKLDLTRAAGPAVS
jgi:GNAT superfamily N-acetyltransferase